MSWISDWWDNLWESARAGLGDTIARSEERRVGKEC